ncbi:MAG: hypothetical protein JOS17DRAFT_765079 [Linnemannia elongata]|nr:MAG: hypothetical protein JOS17DRAFT_765079 [Linnemannia elongata]
MVAQASFLYSFTLSGRLQPRRIAAIANEVLDVIVDTPLTDAQAASAPDSSSTSTLTSDAIPTAPLEMSLPDRPLEEPTVDHAATNPTAPRRNPVYGLEETAMENYSHIDNPAWLPPPRAPQLLLDSPPRAPQLLLDSPSTQHAPLLPSESQPTGTPEMLPDIQPLSHNGSLITTTTSQSPNNSQLQATKNTSTITTKNFRRILQQAGFGQTNVQIALGDLYRDGKEVQQDFQAAKDWYLKAAYKGDAQAQFRMGGLFENGQGVAMNPEVAMKWYRKSADQGYAAAQNRIGLLYDRGVGVPQDYVQAREWFLKAAGQGSCSAIFNVGAMYHSGQGIEQDYRKAMEWYSRAGRLGHQTAKDNAEAIRIWLEKTAYMESSSQKKKGFFRKLFK